MLLNELCLKYVENTMEIAGQVVPCSSSLTMVVVVLVWSLRMTPCRCNEFGTTPFAEVGFCSWVTADCPVAGVYDTMLLPSRKAVVVVLCSGVLLGSATNVDNHT
jgi:hypothetical protein